LWCRNNDSKMMKKIYEHSTLELKIVIIVEMVVSYKDRYLFPYM
jgi:hypothetical protein